MISVQNLQEAEQRIVDLINRQCQHGSQAKALPADMAACGQFLETDYNEVQRGLHGTAAALRVVADAEDAGDGKIVAALVRYVRDRSEVDHAELEAAKLEADCNNVIKISEVLYALYFVKASHAETDTLIRDYSARLQGAIIDGEGWSFFLDESKEPEALPTAFAIYALARHVDRSGLEGPIKFLEKSILQKPSDGSPRLEDSTQIFCLYVLASIYERFSDIPAERLKSLKSAFHQIFRRHEALLDYDIEQNLEYTRKGTNFYIRIPWQLYLIGLSARLRSSARYSSAIQRKLKTISNSVLSGGFRYPYSGRRLSSRTNAIVFEVLRVVRENHADDLRGWIHLIWDRFRNFLSSAWIQYPMGVLLIASVSLVVIDFIWTGNLRDLGPGITASIVGLLISSCFRSLRKAR